MKRALLVVLFLLVLVETVGAQQLPIAPWDVSLKTNTVADSTLTVENRCKQNPQFQVQLANLPFIQFSSTQLIVKGGSTQLVPLKVDTRNLAPGASSHRLARWAIASAAPFTYGFAEYFW